MQIAPLVKKLIVLDVSKEMLERTRQRCETQGLKNVEFVLGNARDFQPVEDQSIDFFFSYDVFVHITMEDTFAYVHEMARVLAPGSTGVCHHAVNHVAAGFFRLEREIDYYRAGKNTIGQYFYHSPESLRRMYEHCGLPVVRTDQWWCMQIMAFRKAEGNFIPELEQLLWTLIRSEDGKSKEINSALNRLQGLPLQLSEYVNHWIKDIRSNPDKANRLEKAAAIRRAWRGLL